MLIHYRDKAGAVWLITLRIKRRTQVYSRQKYADFRRVLIPVKSCIKITHRVSVRTHSRILEQLIGISWNLVVNN